MWQVAEKRNIIISWLVWHYKVSLVFLWGRWRDFMRFSRDYFSIPFLLKTLFSPWRKYTESKGRGFDITKSLEVMVFNGFSRVMGFILRISVIVIGVIAELLFLIIGLTIIIVWLLLPLLTVAGLLLPFLSNEL